LPNLGVYLVLSDDSALVDVLMEGFKDAQKMLRSLNMVTSIVAQIKKWFTNHGPSRKQTTSTLLKCLQKHWLLVRTVTVKFLGTH
jgi:hypothetical protein